MEKTQVQVIPAHPGFRLVINGDAKEEGLFVGEHVIAWRIETERLEGDRARRSEFITSVEPITSTGDAPGNYGGIMGPDGSIETLNGAYDNLEAAQAHYREHEHF